mmetsp:Transcript_9794/g.12073  ORF Transcript_9794/g.12073 Transcript_9794/m.12073 type:complete len:237 (-) Transcript_9794:74-784(-)
MSGPTGQSMYQNDSQPAYNQDVVKPGYDSGYGDVSKGSHGGPPPSGGICELNCDWGNAGATGNAGACTDISKLEPCCGEPCNFKDGLYCCLCSACCGLCVQSKMLAYSVDQECFCVNHCGPYLVVYLVALAIEVTFYVVSAVLGIPLGSVGALGSCFLLALLALTRRNLRSKFNVGSPDSWLGDFFMMCCVCTSPCSLCQEFRSMPISGWDWLGDIRERGFQLIDNSTLGQIVRKY